jgi:hypothetical protein
LIKASGLQQAIQATAIASFRVGALYIFKSRLIWNIPMAITRLSSTNRSRIKRGFLFLYVTACVFLGWWIGGVLLLLIVPARRRADVLERQRRVHMSKHTVELVGCKTNQAVRRPRRHGGPWSPAFGGALADIARFAAFCHLLNASAANGICCAAGSRHFARLSTLWAPASMPIKSPIGPNMECPTAKPMTRPTWAVILSRIGVAEPDQFPAACGACNLFIRSPYEASASRMFSKASDGCMGLMGRGLHRYNFPSSAKDAPL